MDEYSDILAQPYEVPDLPASIKSLTLELFALGYPMGFLGALGEKLRGLKVFTAFEQLFGGTVEGSKDDAVRFVRGQRELREVHFLDVFAPKGFWRDLAGALTDEVKFLEVGVTYRHEDPAFAATLPQGGELAAFVKEGLVGARFAMGAPIRTGDGEEGTEIGIMAVKGKDEGGRELVKALVEKGKGLAMCDVTMFEVSVEEVESVLDACEGLKIAAFSVGITGWVDFFGKMAQKARGVEMLEIVGVPGSGLVEEIKASGDTGLKKETVEKLGEAWKDLKSVKVSLLRTKGEEWVKESEGWVRK